MYVKQPVSHCGLVSSDIQDWDEKKTLELWCVRFSSAMWKSAAHSELVVIVRSRLSEVVSSIPILFPLDYESAFSMHPSHVSSWDSWSLSMQYRVDQERNWMITNPQRQSLMKSQSGLLMINGGRRGSGAPWSHRLEVGFPLDSRRNFRFVNGDGTGAAWAKLSSKVAFAWQAEDRKLQVHYLASNDLSARPGPRLPAWNGSWNIKV
ncbi:hypothetical protein GE21DRAFT_1281274 [Neurospora crassa]|nr:hypothetical protein GE21DRAFT_1281274 [Neurospora crassa]